MSLAGVTRIDYLSKDNYDTWKLQMKALLAKNDAWGYVNGDIRLEDSDPVEWARNDTKAMADIILSIGTSILKQVRNCQTSRELWLKLEGIFESRGPARKAALMTRLISSRMEEGADIGVHLDEFFDTVDKLAQMGIIIPEELVCVLLLNSLPSSYEAFKCAVRSLDNLPDCETLRVKITEETDARKNKRIPVQCLIGN